MNCFSCFRYQRSMKSGGKKGQPSPNNDRNNAGSGMQNSSKQTIDAMHESKIMTFTFRELAVATKNFRKECLLGEGGYGRVYKGTLSATGQAVAVKQLDRHGLRGNKDFASEVVALSQLRHENLIPLIGHCADGDQRVIVYEFMAGGTLQEHLLDKIPEKKPLHWFTRMKIAFGAAKGLEYLHEKANPPILYCDLKPSNILLDENMTPKLSDYGLAQLGPSSDVSPFSSRILGTYGYSAPEYQTSGQLTIKSDVYSFGVVLLEIITGRRAIDTTRPFDEQNLVAWAQPMFKDQKRFPDLADALLEKRFPEKDLNQAVAIAAMCLQEEATSRPLISDVVTALSFLAVEKEFVERNVNEIDESLCTSLKRIGSSSRSSKSKHGSSKHGSSNHGSSKYGSSKHGSSENRSSKHAKSSKSGSNRWSFQSKNGAELERFGERSGRSSVRSESYSQRESGYLSRGDSVSSCESSDGVSRCCSRSSNKL